MTATTIKYGLTDEIAVPANINLGITCPNADNLINFLGNPRDKYSQACENVSNKTLSALIETSDVGPFTVTGLRPAVQSLRIIMNEIRSSQPAVYNKLGTAGMLCCRLQRGSNKISSHSWGTAIDLKLDGKIDVRGNMKVHYGLSLIAPIFNRYGWYWGAAFRTEDAMHFEVGKQKLEEWKKSGLLGVVKVTALKRGDTGPAVRALQEKLNHYGARLKVDGGFGENTEKAVRQFQAAHALKSDGIVGEKTRKALTLL